MKLEEIQQSFVNTPVDDIRHTWDTVLNNWAWQQKDEFISLLRLMKAMRIKSVLEIGCYDGGTARGFLELGCSVQTVDIAPREKATKLLVDFPEKFKFFKGTSNEYLAAVQNGAQESQRFDMAFIDGEHTYEWAMQDYKNVSKLIPPGGIIVFHDILDSEHHRKNNCMVSKVWEEVRGETFVEFKFDKVWAGIGIKFT